MSSNCSIVIPAHMRSTRFPGKPLADVGGRPLLSYSVEAARESGLPWCVATSDDEILDWCLHEHVSCQRTEQCRNGTERAALVNRELQWDRVIVLQCDEPDVMADDLRQLDENYDSPATIITAMAPGDWRNSNTVAADCCGSGVSQDCCFRFIRSANTAEIDRGHYAWSRHVGVYLYDSDLLSEYLEHGPTPRELSESLEQLRTMALGYAWGLMTIPGPLRSVNVPADVEAFK